MDIEKVRSAFAYSDPYDIGDEVMAALKDAERYRFCVERNTMPVIAGDGETWCMFLAVKSSRRSLFTGATPSEAIDAAMQGANA